MLVKAKRLGYYEHKRRYEGDTFEIRAEKHFSKKWMVKVTSGEKKPALKPAPEKGSEPESQKGPDAPDGSETPTGDQEVI